MKSLDELFCDNQFVCNIVVNLVVYKTVYVIEGTNWFVVMAYVGSNDQHSYSCEVVPVLILFVPSLKHTIYTPQQSSSGESIATLCMC